jgi:hypothetical protein
MYRVPLTGVSSGPSFADAGAFEGNPVVELETVDQVCAKIVGWAQNQVQRNTVRSCCLRFCAYSFQVPENA